MEGKTIAISNLKGGVGKTSLVQNIGAELFSKGKKILYVDMDAQQSLSLALKSSGKYRSVFDVLMTGNLTEAIQRTSQGDLIRGDIRLLQITELPGDRLKTALQRIKKDYDYIFIDNPPTYNAIINNSLIASDEVLIPCEADLFSYQGLNNEEYIINSVRKSLNNELKICGIIVNKFEPRSNRNQQILEQIRKKANQMGTKVFKPVRKNVAISKAQDYRSNIFEYDAKSNGASDIKQLVGELLENE